MSKASLDASFIKGLYWAARKKAAEFRIGRLFFISSIGFDCFSFFIQHSEYLTQGQDVRASISNLTDQPRQFAKPKSPIPQDTNISVCLWRDNINLPVAVQWKLRIDSNLMQGSTASTPLLWPSGIMQPRVLPKECQSSPRSSRIEGRGDDWHFRLHKQALCSHNIITVIREACLWRPQYYPRTINGWCDGLSAILAVEKGIKYSFPRIRCFLEAMNKW